jgi:radical SAM-linked protein
VSESRQRWRLVFARDDEARFLSHLDAIKLWERAFRRGGIPVATSEGFSPRPRVIFAAPLQLGMLAEHELADLFLAERLTSHDLRARLAAGMPRGYRIVELDDEWVGAPALAPQLVAADYRLNLLHTEQPAVEEGIRTLLAAERLPRERHREDKIVAYDLRPLLIDLHLRAGGVAARVGEVPEAPNLGGTVAAGSAVFTAATALPSAVAEGVCVWMRLRHTQDEGSGRAEEVVAALAEALPGRGAVGRSEAPAESTAVEMVHPVRERLWLSRELTS